jgi:hypothetical protein
VCVLKSVEPCGSFDLHRNREQPKLEWGVRERPGLFLDHYWMQPVLGFRNARLQSWFPFPLQICRNGREWLARQRDGAGLSEVRQDHCFPWVENGARAQALLDRPRKVDWPHLRNAMAGQLTPRQAEVFAKDPLSCDWSR